MNKSVAWINRSFVDFLAMWFLKVTMREVSFQVGETFL